MKIQQLTLLCCPHFLTESSSSLELVPIHFPEAVRLHPLQRTKTTVTLGQSCSKFMNVQNVEYLNILKNEITTHSLGIDIVRFGTRITTHHRSVIHIGTMNG